MEMLRSSEDLMKYISRMDNENSVCQFHIPGKRKCTLVLQEEDQTSISDDAEKDPELKEMIAESRRQYKQGKGISTSELLRSLSKEDFS